MSEGSRREMLLLRLLLGGLRVKILEARLLVWLGGLDVLVLTSVEMLEARLLPWLGGVRAYCVLSTLRVRVLTTGGDSVT